jgi:hypothetical protein
LGSNPGFKASGTISLSLPSALFVVLGIKARALDRIHLFESQFPHLENGNILYFLGLLEQ